jgi:hypothetical protein
MVGLLDSLVNSWFQGAVLCVCGHAVQLSFWVILRPAAEIKVAVALSNHHSLSLPGPTYMGFAIFA